VEYNSYGRHILADVYGVNAKLLDDLAGLTTLLVDAANDCGATVLGVESKHFDPSGVTVLVLLSESHVSIHTYPDLGFAAVDCYTCGDIADPQKAIDYILEVLKPKKVYMKRHTRGMSQEINEY
jgi:S-adenosylmethionine decarboxylase